MRFTEGLILRFLSKIGPVGGGCIEWQDSHDSDGYGQITLDGVHWKAHRLSYAMFVGPIPDGLLVCHHCDNPPCISPTHLFLGTNLDNMADQVAKGRSIRGERHYNAKLTKADICEIRRLIAAGQSGDSVGRQFGISGVQARRIFHRQTWAYLPDEVTHGAADVGRVPTPSRQE